MDHETREQRRIAARRRVQRQRRVALMSGAGALLAALLLFALASAGGGRASRPTRPRPPALAQLPGGGRVVLPGHLVVAYYGAPGTSTLGVLGSQSPRQDRAPPHSSGGRLPLRRAPRTARL